MCSSSALSVWESPVEVWINSGLPQGQRHWLQQSLEPWCAGKSFWRRSPLPPLPSFKQAEIHTETRLRLMSLWPEWQECFSFMSRKWALNPQSLTIGLDLSTTLFCWENMKRGWFSDMLIHNYSHCDNSWWNNTCFWWNFFGWWNIGESDVCHSQAEMSRVSTWFAAFSIFLLPLDQAMFQTEAVLFA